MWLTVASIIDAKGNRIVNAPLAMIYFTPSQVVRAIITRSKIMHEVRVIIVVLSMP
jgi:hypothetical protein